MKRRANEGRGEEGKEKEEKEEEEDKQVTSHDSKGKTQSSKSC